MNSKLKKILITGSAGLIGSSLHLYLKQKGYLVCGTDLVESATTDFILDISNRGKFKTKLYEIKPDIIIHAAAIKGLNECEKNKTLAWDTNVESTAEIVQYAYMNNVKIIYVSSDVVFDGKIGDYKETDLPNPINWYGTTKYHGELLVDKVAGYAICRTALVIGELRGNCKNNLNIELESETLNNQSLLPYFIIGKLRRNNKINLSNQTISCPTQINLLALAIETIINKNLSGIFHCTGSEPISRFNFALEIARRLNLDRTLIQEDLRADFAFRPKNLHMNIKDTYTRLGLSIADWDIDSLITKLCGNTQI